MQRKSGFMSNAESEVLLVKNSQSGNGTADRRAEELSNRLKNVRVKDFTELQKSEIRKIPKKVIILGGDGTVQASIAWLKTHDELPIIIIAGGGTGNTFRKNVISEGATIALKDIADSDELVRASLSFRPAVIKGETNEEKNIFVVGAGFGKLEKGYSKYRETIRQLPLPSYFKRKISEALAMLTAGIPSTDSQEESFLHLYSICPMLHGIRIFPSEELSLSSTSIGLVEVKGENLQIAFIKFLYAVSLWQMGEKVPSSIVLSKVNTIFSYPTGQEGSGATLDGEVRQLNGNINLAIRRSDIIFPVVALV